MLTIEHVDVEENIQLGDLFNQIGVGVNLPHDHDEDICVANEFAIDVMSLDGYYPIEAFRLTKREETRDLLLVDGRKLSAASKHLVCRHEGNKVGVWREISEIRPGDMLSTDDNGLTEVSSVSEPSDEKYRLYDLQVGIAHSYLTNGILSHNSHFLTMLGANAMRQGYNVLYYTLELSESKIGIRFDSNFTGIDSNDIINQKDDVDKFYAENKLGRLMIKYFPTNQPTVNALRAHMEKLSLRGFVPDLLIIDYADIMRSSRQYDSPRHELKLLYEELRAFAAERNVALWTASQSNREGSNVDIVDMNNMSEAYSKAFIADLIVTISRKSSERAEGHGRLYVAKNRNGRDGLVFPVKIDTARSKFTIIGEQTTPEDVREQDQHDVRKALKDRFQKYEKLNLKQVG